MTAPPFRPLPTGRRLTSEGVVWALTVLLLLVVGIAKTINLLALLGYMLLALLGLLYLVVGRRLERLEVRRFLDHHVFAGMSARLEVRLHNTSGKAGATLLRGVRVEDLGPHHEAIWYFDEVPPDDRQARTTEVVLPVRGWYDFAPLTVSSAFPFGLVRRRVLASGPMRVLVYPRPGKIQRERLRQYLRGADPRGERSHRRGWRHETAQADFHGLRPFRTGDSPRWIHWRTSARRGELMVREFEDVPGDDLLLFVDASAAPGPLFEAMLSLAATLIHEWCQRRGDRLVLVVVGRQPAFHDDTTSPEHARELLGFLALLPAGEANVPDTAGDLPPEVAGLPPSLAPVVLSVGSAALARRVEADLRRPIVHLDVEHAREWSFYTPPGG